MGKSLPPPQQPLGYWDRAHLGYPNVLTFQVSFHGVVLLFASDVPRGEVEVLYSTGKPLQDEVEILRRKHARLEGHLDELRGQLRPLNETLERIAVFISGVVV